MTSFLYLGILQQQRKSPYVLTRKILKVHTYNQINYKMNSWKWQDFTSRRELSTFFNQNLKGKKMATLFSRGLVFSLPLSRVKLWPRLMTFSLVCSPKEENRVGNQCTCLWHVHEIFTFLFIDYGHPICLLVTVTKFASLQFLSANLKTCQISTCQICQISLRNVRLDNDSMGEAIGIGSIVIGFEMRG